jgi:hypothetical protein
MATRLGRWFVVLAVIFATGTHWFFLQSIAWVGMAVDFSRTEPIGVAIEKTFSGEHPCGLCQVVDAGRKAEKKSEFQKVETKLDFFCERVIALVAEPAPFVRPVPPHHFWRGFSDSPALPPPESA